ncbi:MAG: hypothetical protein NTY01_07285 [Verrucomicrobia bacterium]|nr:hypothetical protein [Verrucomicrobiota bacterium]
MTTAIQITGLGKRYRYVGAAPLSTSLRADITDWAKRMMGRKTEDGRPGTEDGRPKTEDRKAKTASPVSSPPSSVFFWALRDVSLDIRQGEGGYMSREPGLLQPILEWRTQSVQDCRQQMAVAPPNLSEKE